MQLIKIWATFLSSFLYEYHRNADAHTKHTHRLKDFGTMSHKSRIYIDAYLCTFKFIFFVYKHANGNEHLCEKNHFFVFRQNCFCLHISFYSCPLVYYFFVLADIKVSPDLCHYGVFTPYTRTSKGCAKVKPFPEIASNIKIFTV